MGASVGEAPWHSTRLIASVWWVAAMIDPLFVELLLVVLHFLDAVHKILQLKAQGDKGKGRSRPCSDCGGSVSALRTPVPQGFELPGYGLYCLMGFYSRNSKRKADPAVRHLYF